MLEHKHIIIKASVLNPPMEDKLDFMVDWLKNLISKIGMNILMGPFAVYSNMVGNRGMTVTAIINTSHFAMHTWDEDGGTLQIDLYTCGSLKVDDVLEELAVFNPVQVKYFTIDRATEEFLIEQHNDSIRDISGSFIPAGCC